jgi:hypothetical protein
MALFSFQRRFVDPIKAGTKRQTIRARRKNLGSHGKPGGPISLVHGSRFKPVPLGSSVCRAVNPITLNLALGVVRQELGPRHISIVDAPGPLDTFARADGFEDWADLCAFWAHHHPGLTLFHGIITTWGDLNQ